MWSRLNIAVAEKGCKQMKIDCSKTLNYSQEFERMCDAHSKRNGFNDCSDSCPFHGFGNCSSMTITQEKIDIVQKWSDEHPLESMAEHFRKMFPNAPKYENGDPQCCPYHLGWDDTDDCPNNGPGEGVTCTECWNRLYREAGVGNG